MEAAASLFLCLGILALFVVSLAYVYKRRENIKKWLNPPYYAEDDRELRLKRRIQDCQAELDAINKAKNEIEE